MTKRNNSTDCTHEAWEVASYRNGKESRKCADCREYLGSFDVPFEIPPGFLPHLVYRRPRSGNNGEMEAEYGYVELAVVTGKNVDVLLFYVGDGDPDSLIFPALPLKVSGKISHANWEIPTNYAVDYNGNCWMDNGHGMALEMVESRILLATADNEWDNHKIRIALDMKPKLPQWASSAILNGWTPPPSFNRSDYE